MKFDRDRLLSEARKILENNWRGTHTVPSPDLYPHQWSWDSAFTAIGYAHYDQGKAEQELLSLFEGQWRNGLLPHIIFRSKDSYFPGPDYWQANLSPSAPEIKTSGIVQPPVHAIAALCIYSRSPDKKSTKGFLENLFPQMLEFHRYLFTERDPERTGLVTIFHPWESGFDNSIRWDEALSRITVQHLPKYQRMDIKKVDKNQRPSDVAYDRYIYLVELMKRNKYEAEAIYKTIPFKIKDVVFSSILYVANKSLMEIANIIGVNDDEIRSWTGRTKKNYFKYLCPKKTKTRLVYDYDLVSNQVIQRRTSASLIPTYTGLLSQEQAEAALAWMRHSHFCSEGCTHDHPVATSISLDDKEFNPLNYWRGPIWININWMLYRGIKNYGFYQETKKLKNAIIDLVAEHGFYEYYNPLSGEGLGASNFSWTASLLIDLLSEKDND